MTFNSGAQLDPSQVSDRRGGGGAGIPIVVGGGGGIGLIITVIALLLGINPFGEGAPGGDLGQLSGQSVEPGVSQVANCQTGADANTREDCRIVGYVNSVQTYWNAEFAKRNARYQPAKTVFFSGATQTGCGTASSATGPFYCPNDRQVYIDLSFYDTLKTRFGASGNLAQAYVIAHEYGHHIQNMIGILDRYANDQSTGPNSPAVAIELQADCFAGLWARNAVQTGFLAQVSEQDLRDALGAAAAVGDDRIQRQTQGRVTPESWTHGSAQQRQQWFARGYQGNQLEQCNPFG